MRYFEIISEAATPNTVPATLYHGTTPYNAALIRLLGTIETNESRDEDDYSNYSVCTTERKDVAEWFYDVVRVVEQPFGFVFTIDTSDLDHDEIRPFEAETAGRPEYEWRIYDNVDMKTSATGVHIVGYDRVYSRKELAKYVQAMEKGYSYDHRYDEDDIVETLIGLIEDCGGEVDDSPEYETTVIKAGTILYHGTDDDDFDLYEGLWVSNSIEVCKEFIKRNGGFGGTPRILAFKVNEDLELPIFDNSDDFEEFLISNDISTYGAEDMRDDAVRAGVAGWVIPHNYGHDQADILITNTSYLDFEGAKEV